MDPHRATARRIAHPHEIVEIRLRSRWSAAVGMVVSVYVIGDLLVDAGFTHARDALLPALADLHPRAVCCTHHHEDHVGACAALQRLHGCPVYLHLPALRGTEGVDHPRPYRRLWWGPPEPFQATEYPGLVEAERTLRAIPTPGHSASHVALYEAATGVVFTGDLFISSGASAVMTHEDPCTLARSLRAVATLQPSLLLSGHGLALPDPAAALLRKAEHIEQVAADTRTFHAQGLPPRQIARRIFTGHRLHDLLLASITGGEFSRLNFVRAVLREQQPPVMG